MSGTCAPLEQAAEHYGSVEVYDTRTVSSTLTLLVERLRARLAEGVSLAEAHAYIEHFLRESHALPGRDARVPAPRRPHRPGAVDGRRRVRHQAAHPRRRRRARGYAKVRGEQRALDAMAALRRGAQQARRRARGFCTIDADNDEKPQQIRELIGAPPRGRVRLARPGRRGRRHAQRPRHGRLRA